MLWPMPSCCIGALPAIIVVLFSFRRTSGPVFQPGVSLQSYETSHLDRVRADLEHADLLVGRGGGHRHHGHPDRLSDLAAPNIATGALDALLMVPYVVPGIVMGIAFITRFNDPPLALTGTGLIIIMAVFIRRLPYSARSVAAALKQVGPNLEDAAVSLGYSPGKAFMKVTVPLIVPGILAGALMSFVTAMNELSSSLVLYVGQHDHDAGAHLSLRHGRRVRHGLGPVDDPPRHDRRRGLRGLPPVGTQGERASLRIA